MQNLLKYRISAMLTELVGWYIYNSRNIRVCLPRNICRSEIIDCKYYAVRHTSPHRTQVHTPYVMLPQHHIDFLHF